ncbi:apolipoprotein N-acyltransferase [Sphingobium sp. LB126]|uniref:apolipoprotein N-acyltransferase n=1 Tax=Sphingobium sp. LB126 TaxID=1983755 RepID=UPI000C204EC9|nr:apolipoprotein N-acyltransferase [Sphingobium sp. LB126]PJG49038.1 apolipoprotein N-acyltransferase [Sphingobium sp. LB126]
MKHIPARFPKLTALLAGFLAATGFEPLKLWPVTLACFALLIVLIEQAPSRRSAFSRGWLFGVGHFTLGLNWIAHAFTFQDSMPHWFGYGAVVLLSLYLAVYPGLATLMTWWLGNHVFLRRQEPSPAVSTGLLPTQEYGKLPLILLFAATWLAAEYLRATAFTGFAWNPLGVTLLPTGIAIASTLIGTYGVGALVILASGALLVTIRRQFKPAAAIAAPLCALALWSLLSPAPTTPPGAPRIRIVQPNIGQDEKYSPELEQAHFQTLATLSGTPRPAPRLIFWPEAAIPAYLDLEPEWRARLAALLGPGDLLMTGATKVYFRPIEKNGVLENTLAGANNSLFIVDPGARLLGRYDKSHLVPYGEYLPMRELLQPLGLSRLVPGAVDFWPGPGPQSLLLPATLGRPQLKMGVQICYEIIFSGQVVDEANRPDFLFNPSNDAWFGSWGPVQHLAQARLRALEEGIPIIRSTPTGVSAVVDARGHILSHIGHHRAGFLDTALPPALPPTLFARLGNWAPFAFMLALIALAIATRRTTR